MKTEVPIKELLRWRLAQAEAGAPPAPRAAKLLALVRPWWETWPEQLQLLVERLGKMEVAYGHAMASVPSRCSYPVPAVLVLQGEELEATVRVLYLTVRSGQLRLRFQIEATAFEMESDFEVTFVSTGNSQQLFCATATQSLGNEYRVDADLPAELVESWKELKVTDRMPFALILRSQKIRD